MHCQTLGRNTESQLALSWVTCFPSPCQGSSATRYYLTVSREGALGAGVCVLPRQFSEQLCPLKAGRGGVGGAEAGLLTADSDSAPPQLNIDSCWVGSFYCPQASFTATIYDAIATESTLFIRQNQLVYYFTGTYVTLHESNQGSGEGVPGISGKGSCLWESQGGRLREPTHWMPPGLELRGWGGGRWKDFPRSLMVTTHPIWLFSTLYMLV